LEEYKVAFGESPGNRGDISARSQPDTQPHNYANKKSSKQSSSNAGHANSSNSPGSPRGREAPRQQQAQQQQQPQQNVSMDGSVEDFTVCSFCGKEDKTWKEDALDLHYWKDCPLLCPCPACAQVVEIAGLPDHLLTECEQQSKFATCEVTGLAIRVEEFDSWCKSPSCRPPPVNCMYCPLCLATVEDSDEAWRQHLVLGCPQNPRVQSNTKA